MIIGITEPGNEYSYLSEFSDVQSIGYTWNPDVEKILELEPDAIIIHPGPGPGGDLNHVVRTLEDSGMTVLCFRCNLPESYPEEIEALGHLFEREDEAEKFSEFYESVHDSIGGITDSIPDERRPKVYSEWKPYYTSSLDAYPIEMAGGKYIFAGAGPIKEVDPEAVISQDPDIIIRIVWDEDYDAKMTDDTAKLEETREEMLNRPELQNVTAVKNGNVFVIASPLWTYLPYSGCRHFIGIGYLAKWFHPDLFGNLDPETVHQQYLTEFQGVSYDLNERGVFVYPAPDGY